MNILSRRLDKVESERDGWVDGAARNLSREKDGNEERYGRFASRLLRCDQKQIQEESRAEHFVEVNAHSTFRAAQLTFIICHVISEMETLLFSDISYVYLADFFLLFGVLGFFYLFV